MSRGTVLLVDDNALTRRFIQLALRDEGVTIVEAVGVRSALAIAETTKADLVLLDLVLADGSGFDLVEPLRKALGAPVPVLAVTGLISRNDEGRLGSAGFDDIVNKPIDPLRLRAAVRAYLPERTVPRDRFGTGKRLVFADDDPVQRKLGVFRLARLGFEVHAAADGQEAFDLATKVRADVVVSDVLMPRVDGFELCVRIRRDPALSQVPVVLLTNSYLEEADRALANKIGADGYLIRTPDLRDVTDALRALVGPRERVSHVAVTEDASASRERLARAAQQLDRQLALNVTLTQRTSVLSAQLNILAGLTRALVEQGDIENALDQALHACLDAGGISWGLLVVRQREQWTCRSLGLTGAEKAQVDRSLDTLVDRLRGASDGRTSTRVSDTLVGGQGGEALVVPIVWRDELLGAIVLRLSPSLDEQRQGFVQVVAGQLALVVALARTFQRLDDSSKQERSRARLIESTLDAVGTPLLVIDAEGRATGWNQPGEAFRFLTPGPGAERPKLLTGDESRVLASAEEPICRALAGEPVDDAEVCARRSNEEPRWLRITARPFRGDDEQTAGAVAVVRDVTDERRANARQIVNDRLASVGVLAAGIAHEINNPLTSVLAEIEMAVARIPGMDRAIEHLNTALDAAHRVRTIVSDLRTLSREGSGDALVAVDVARALDTALRMAVPHTRGRVEVKTEIGELPWILGNEGRLVQVFLNLIVNAAQAMNGLPAERRVIRIRATRGRDAGAKVEIADTGTGMTAEVRHRIFTPFFTTKPLGTGTGLGLSICQRIITQLGGTIDCDSAPDRGTTFTLWLPPASADRVEARAPAADPRGSLRVLVVDADPFARQMVTRTLRANHDVVALDTADVAWLRIEGGEPFDLVLYDGEAPALRAHELWSRLEGPLEPVRQRLVFLLGPTTSTGTREFLASIPARSLEKPIDASALKKVVAEARSPNAPDIGGVSR